MKREIKYRQPIRNKKGEFVEWFYWDIFISPAIQQNGLDTRSESQQFTGLTDKNGKEIYEGDILRCPAKDSWEKTNYTGFEVFFHDGDAHLNYDIGYSMCRTHHHGSVCGGAILSFKPKTVKKMEIIGNIYENPELL